MGAFQADGMLTIGMTDHAQELLGDLVFVELPDVGRDWQPDRKPPSSRSRPLPMYMRWWSARWSKPTPPLQIHRNTATGMRIPPGCSD